MALLLLPLVTAGAAEPTAPQRAWTLAASALLTERNGHRHDLLAGVELTPGNIAATKRILRDWWGVTDRVGLLDSLTWLRAAGHRVQFAGTATWLAALAPEQRRELELQRRKDFRLNQKIGVVELHSARLGPTGILGWDLTRYLSLCRWGYGAGYLTEQEAWDAMFPAARALRYSFTSWRELGENYVIGRQFWDPDEHVKTGDQYRNVLDRLLSDPDSPWNRVPWNLDLGAPDGVPVRDTGASHGATVQERRR